MARLVPMLSVPTTASPVFRLLRILLEDMDSYDYVNKPGRLPSDRYRTMLIDMISPWDITGSKPDARAQRELAPSYTLLQSEAFKSNAGQ